MGALLLLLLKGLLIFLGIILTIIGISIIVGSIEISFGPGSRKSKEKKKKHPKK